MRGWLLLKSDPCFPSGFGAVPVALRAGGTWTPGMGRGRAGGFSRGPLSGWGQQSQVCLLDAAACLATSCRKPCGSLTL